MGRERTILGTFHLVNKQNSVCMSRGATNHARRIARDAWSMESPRREPCSTWPVFQIERQSLHSVGTVAVDSGQTVELRLGRAGPNRLAGVSIRNLSKTVKHLTS
jgi:hypothetical protein